MWRDGQGLPSELARFVFANQEYIKARFVPDLCDTKHFFSFLSSTVSFMLSAIISAGFLALSVASLAIPIPENQVPAELESKFPNNFFQHRAPPTRGGNGNGKNVGGNSVNAPDHGKSIEGAAVNAPEEAKLRGFNVKVDNK